MLIRLTNSFMPNDFHRLTFNLCFVYQRCTRSISLVAPVYYASMVAMRSRFYMKPGAASEGSVVSGSSWVRGIAALCMILTARAAT